MRRKLQIIPILFLCFTALFRDAAQARAQVIYRKLAFQDEFNKAANAAVEEATQWAALKSSPVVTVPPAEAIANIKRIALHGQSVQTARDIVISFGAPEKPEYVV